MFKDVEEQNDLTLLLIDDERINDAGADLIPTVREIDLLDTEKADDPWEDAATIAATRLLDSFILGRLFQYLFYVEIH
jgi:hypothetical protein